MAATKMEEWRNHEAIEQESFQTVVYAASWDSCNEETCYAGYYSTSIIIS